MAQEQHETTTGGTGLGHRSVTMTRTERGTYLVTNARGGTLSVGGGGESSLFTPVELFLTAMAACSATDVDYMTSRIAEPVRFDVTAEGEKLRDGVENHLGDIEVTFTVRFPEGEDGDRARARLPRSIEQSRDRLCTVSRTVQRGAPVAMREA
ncbi:OsmC family protein [Fodinibacter luteus]|uniref:OsmC family protein n=1 Tax=Fodinibacter luteus TaxID=552064 RepID=A0ABP8KEF3_9MICO